MDMKTNVIEGSLNKRRMHDNGPSNYCYTQVFTKDKAKEFYYLF